MAVTIRHIAKELNLSHATVSRVLNNRDIARIPETTRERVRQMSETMGYRPNHAARTLVTGRSRLVALQLYTLSSAFWSGVARQLQALAWEDGYEVLAHESSGQSDRLRAVVDGVFLLDRLCSAEELRQQRLSGKPHISLGSYHSGESDLVAVDLRQSSLEVMETMLRRGRRRIAYLGYRDPFGDESDQRLSVYREKMAAMGLPDIIIPAHVNNRTQGHAALTAYLARGSALDALFCGNDEVATGAYKALTQRGLRIPDDVAVAGCDGIEEGLYLTPSLTTIVQPVAEMCDCAWRFMKRRLDAPDAEAQRTTLFSRLERRDSL